MLLHRQHPDASRSAPGRGDAAACRPDRHRAGRRGGGTARRAGSRAAPPVPMPCCMRRRSFATSNGTARAGGRSRNTSPRADLRVVATGGPAPEERAYLDRVWDGVEISRLDGALSWPQLTSLIAGRSRLSGPRYLGDASGRSHRLPDRGAVRSDRSAPLGAVAGRRPATSRSRPHGTVQRRGNVFVVQNPLPGMPCGLEGCLRNVRSHSLCLDQMSAEIVIRTLDEALTLGAAAGDQGGAAPQTPLFRH